MTRLGVLSVAAALCLSAPLFVSSHAAANPQEAIHVDEAFALTAERKMDGSIAFEWAIEDGYYLYRDRIELTAPDGERVAFETPEGEPKDDPYFGRLEIYHDAASADVEAQTIANLPAGTTLQLSYQGCQDGGICYAPETKSIDIADLGQQPIAFGASPASPGDQLRSLGSSSSQPRASSSPAGGWTLSDETASQMPTIVSNPPEGATTSDAGQAALSGIVADASAGSLLSGFLDEGGALFAIGAFFLLGLGLAFTPCVFPMYPILAGQLGRVGGERSALKGALHSGTYVLAMAAAFGVIGIAAAWFGGNLQMALQSPVAVGLVSALFLVLALSMFGAFSLRLPAVWTSAVDRAMPGKRGGLASSAGLGFLSALVVGPCVTAPLAGALLYITQTGDIGLGAAALFALGLGQGVPLVLFGTIGSRVLPKAGPWMEVVTKAFGFAFLAMAIWMASRILEPWITVGLWGILILVLATTLGTFVCHRSEGSLLLQTGRLASVVAWVLGSTLLVGSVAGARDPFNPLAPLIGESVTANAMTDEALQFASVSGPTDLARRVSNPDRPKLLYFTADWCVSCKVIEREVFNDPRVRAGLEGFDLMKVDVTETTRKSDSLSRQLSVVGPPTMLFIEKNGVEAPGTRMVGEVSAEDFLSRVKEL